MSAPWGVTVYRGNLPQLDTQVASHLFANMFYSEPCFCRSVFVSTCDYVLETEMLRQREWSSRFLIHMVEKVILLAFHSDLSQDTCHDSLHGHPPPWTPYIPISKRERALWLLARNDAYSGFSHRCHQVRGQPGRPRLRAGKLWAWEWGEGGQG